MPHDTNDATTQIAKLSTREHRTLTRIYQHPMTHNLKLRDVTDLFNSIGGADPQHNGEICLSVGDEKLTLVRPHSKDMTTDEVILIRHFLDRTGWGPDASNSVKQAAPETTDMVIVIDHTGARVHRLGSDDEPRHLLHNIDHKNHDRDREETSPDDQQFFADVAQAVCDADRIVVIGHGHGQSNEADHLIAWLDSHNKLVRARIERLVQADLPHMTDPELLAFATQSLAQPASDATGKDTS